MQDADEKMDHCKRNRAIYAQVFLFGGVLFKIGMPIASGAWCWMVEPGAVLVSSPIVFIYPSSRSTWDPYEELLVASAHLHDLSQGESEIGWGGLLQSIILLCRINDRK